MAENASQSTATKPAVAEAESVILKVAFLADDSTAARWWLSLLRQSPGIDVVQLWSKKREATEALHASPEAASVPASRMVWGDGGSAQGRKSLKSLAQSQTIKLFIIAASPEHHADLLETIFSVPEGREKHIFSCTPPTFSTSRMRRLLDLHEQKPHGVWSVCTSFTHEVAATKAKAILLDLGQLVTAQLNCTSLLQNQAVAECGNAASLLKQGKISELIRGSCCSFVSLLRDMFGDISTVSSVQTGDSGTLAGHLHFERGPCVSLLVDLNSPVSSFELMAWGVKGHAKLQWDVERKAFEVHRFLQHYEHPTLHPVTGPTWALKDWARAVVGVDIEAASQPLPCSATNFLENLAVSDSLLKSQGNVVDLKMCREEPNTHQQPLRAHVPIPV